MSAGRSSPSHWERRGVAGDAGAIHTESWQRTLPSSLGSAADPGEQAVEDALAADLALGRGVVALPEEDGRELGRGHEVAARLADRLEVAVQLDRPRAIAVAEHAPVHLAAELGHLAPLGLGRELLGLVVERLDLGADLEVLVGDGA